MKTGTVIKKIKMGDVEDILSQLRQIVAGNPWDWLKGTYPDDFESLKKTKRPIPFLHWREKRVLVLDSVADFTAELFDGVHKISNELQE